jgi:nucleotide-binding universal stress UspA family protein
MDLIVTGTRGHGALAGLALGSVTNKLIALTKVPVLVIPGT